MRLSDDEARRRFRGARVMRLATVRPDGRPHLVVATFALLTDPDRPGAPGVDTVVTAVDYKAKTTTRLARLRHIAADPRVSLLVDHYDDRAWSRLWWVRADGRATVQTADADRAGPVRELVAKYPQYVEQPPNGPVIRVEVDRWQGWAASPT